jgi:tetratricopeptide (TPR) repeat protein
MALGWFNSSKAAGIAIELADQFSHQQVTPHDAGDKPMPRGKPLGGLNALLDSADRQVRGLRLNFFKKARFANSFKWRLRDNGINKEVADEITERLLMHLSESERSSKPSANSPPAPAERTQTNSAKYYLSRGNAFHSAGAFTAAVGCYQELLKINPRHALGLNNLGAAYCQVGRYQEAENCFRQAIDVKPKAPEAYNNLGNTLRWMGRIDEAEILLRRALKLDPRYSDARTNLGTFLAFHGRVREARIYLKKALKFNPRNADALLGMGHIAALEGRFNEAESLFDRALEVNPMLPGALAAIVSVRKMTSADSAWLARAEVLTASVVAPLDEADMRFAIGKYHDDIGNFERSFQNYQRANELLKTLATDYDRAAHSNLVDHTIRTFSSVPAQAGSSTSSKPVFVIGMMRSGTSLAVQIIASHHSAKGAGELPFWSAAADTHRIAISEGSLGEATRKRLAEDYLRVLEAKCPYAARVVDKAPVNSDNLGLIHSVFPNARIIYMQRDPIDTCLSIYFQRLSPAINFATDLADLAHYYREHRRLMAHWRAVLPAGSILDVPYAELLADQEKWTRRILEFLGLDWDAACLEFHRTEHVVATSSFWQVRQPIYQSSVGRWRNYKRFIGPLLRLAD